MRLARSPAQPWNAAHSWLTVFLPAVQIIQVEDIPYTVNMKRVEVPVKKVGVSQLCVLPGEPTQLGGCLGSGLDGGAKEQKRVC